LPVDRVRTPDLSFERGHLDIALPPVVGADVDRLAVALGVGSADVLVASWLALVVRLSGQPDFTAGLVVPTPDNKTVAPVPLSLDVSRPFADLIRVVVDACTTVAARVDRAFPALRAASGGDDTDPLFRVAVTSVAADQECDGAELVLVRGDAPSLEYSGVYDRATADDIASQWVRLLGALVADPDAPCDTFELLDEETRARLRGWGTGWFAPVPPWTVPTRFAEQVAAHPERIAVRCADHALTYAQLADRAFRLAQVLSDKGAAPGTRVAVCLQRSTDMLVALVGVLASGAAYVPVDPAYPAERVEYMLTDADVVAVVTSSDLVPSLPATGAHVVELDLSAGSLDAVEPADPAVGGATLDDTAYVIYTSGSTGKPKGVMVPHRGLTNFLDSVALEPGLADGETLLAVTTLSFDIAGLELYLPLVAGGTVLIATHDECRDPAALAKLLVDHDVTQMQATPATWRLLLDWGWHGKANLVVLCGGEALPPTLADALVPKCAALWNMYGPTETTIWSTLYHLQPGELPTLGHPFRNTTVHVVDARTREVGIGVAGEMLIGGDGLAQGYLGRPDLTAEKFIASPFVDFVEAGERVYRTGDLVRWRSDGRLEFLGRIDNQVKVRGFRIELGEIETSLGNHADVAEAVVVVREDIPGDKQLVGYVVLKAAATATPADLRRHVAASLPGYMVPAAIVICERFPRTPNGKTDRRALPAPDSSASARDDLVAPRDELERRLVATWEDVLGIRPIGVTDNFFDLGVDSLTAARLFARVERDFGAELPLAPVFRAPTVSALAELLRGEDDQTRRWSSLVPMQTQGSARPIFGVHGGAGTILLYQQLSRQLGDDQPFYGLQFAGLYGGEAPDLSIEAMADRYIAELRQVQPGGPYTFLGYCFGALVAQEMALRLMDQGEEIALVATLNGPSMSYINKFGGEIPPDRELPESKAVKLRMAASRGPIAVGLLLAGSAFRRARKPLVRRWRNWRFDRAYRSRKPLPDWLREGQLIQRICLRAQNRYRPRHGSFPVAVFRAPDLYHYDDLGWSEHTDGPVSAFAVPGEGQDVPRSTMRDPYVAFIADRLRELIGETAAVTRSG
jgi:amino acid adenylation domain-containing protein